MTNNDAQSYAPLTSKRKPSAQCVLSVGMRLVVKAIARVVVDHAGSLHESVADGGSDESEPAAFQVLAHRVGF